MNTQTELYAVQIQGGAYDGHYVNTHTGDGWYDTVTNIEEATKRDKATTESRVSSIRQNAQYCYVNRAKIVMVPVN